MPLDNDAELDAVLVEALKKPPEQRAAYLEEVGRSDPRLRKKLEHLLYLHDRAGRFLEEPPVAELETPKPTIGESAGESVGRYKLLEKIGEGGFGTVWMAEQREPVKRRVALKVIKLGMDTQQVIARFEAERQALAMMEHVNIARVLDAGATESGRPFFVMELVKGIPITDYCDQNNLTVQERLDLFTLVCSAVQHAHQKGIIHRDIKPSNVLVTLHDGVPVPKVIDFGIAKATSADLTEKTVFTEHGQMIGTPVYMSPEQAEMSGLDIDTRSDIYSLGVLLYELLTGTTPVTIQELREAGFAEIRRLIREQEPQKPSTRLSSLDTLPSIAAHRRIEPRKLGLLIRGDLDWIIMRALEKDRTRRYRTADAFAADLGRFLADEPVLASPPSSAYRVRKFVRRNRTQVFAGALVAAALVLGTVTTTLGLLEARAEGQRARNAESEQKRLRLAAVAARERADDLRETAQERSLELRRRLYAGTVAQAMDAWRARDLKRMRELVELAPEQERGWEWRYLRWLGDRSIARREYAFPEPDGAERNKVAWDLSDDGSLLATTYRSGSVAVWETLPLRQVARFQAYPEESGAMYYTGSKTIKMAPVSSLAFADGGRMLLTISSSAANPTVLWNIATGTAQRTLPRVRGSRAIPGLAVDREGARLVYWDSEIDSGLAVRELPSGRLLCVLEAPPMVEQADRFVRSLVFLPDGSRIAGNTQGREVFVWDVASGALLQRFEASEGGVSQPLSSGPLAVSPDSRLLAMWSSDQKIRLWDLRTGELAQELSTRQGGPILAPLAFDSEGGRLAAFDGSLTVWEVRTGSVLRAFPTPPWFRHRGLPKFDRYGRTLWLHAPEGSQAFDVSTADEVLTIRGSPLPANFGARLEFPNGDRDLLVQPLGIQGATPPAVLYDAASGQPLRTLATDRLCCLSRSGGRKALALPSRPYQTEIVVLDAFTEEEILRIPGIAWLVSALALDPSGERLAYSSWVQEGGFYRSTTRIVATETGAVLVELVGLDSVVDRLQFSPDGTRVGGMSWAGKCCLWDAETGQALYSGSLLLRGADFSWSRDSAVVAVASDGTQLLDGISGAELDRISTGIAVHAALHPDGRRLAVCAGRRIAVWDIQTDGKLLELDAPERNWLAVAFSGDGDWLAALAAEGEVFVWECREPDEATRELRALREVGIKSQDLLRRLRREGIVGEALPRWLDEGYGESAEVLAVARRAAAEPDEELAAELNNLAWEVIDTASAGDEALRRAVALAEEAARLAPGEAFIQNTLGVGLHRIGEHARAVATLHESVRLNAAGGIGDHPVDQAVSAASLQALGRTEEASAALRRCAELASEKQWSSDEPWMQAEGFWRYLSLAEKAVFGPARAPGDESSATSFLYERRLETYGSGNPLTEDALLLRAEERLSAGELEGAEDDYRTAIEAALEGRRTPGVAASHLGRLRAAQRQWLEAAQASRRLVGVLRRRDPGGSEELAAELVARTYWLYRAGTRGEELESAVSEALHAARNHFDGEDLRLAEMLRLQGTIHWMQQRPAEAESPLREALAICRAQERPARNVVALMSEIVAVLGHGLLQQARWTEAELLLRECLQIRESRPQQDWLTFSARSLLGGALSGQGRFAEAEPLLLRGFEGMHPPPADAEKKQEALQRIIRLYEAWDEVEPGAGHDAKARRYASRMEPKVP